jgi:hypothetical protein
VPYGPGEDVDVGWAAGGDTAGTVVVVGEGAFGSVVVVVDEGDLGDVGGAVGMVVVVVVVVVGGTTGHPVGVIDSVVWAAGAVATTVPPWLAPTTVAPLRSEPPGRAMTATPELGVMASTVAPPDDSCTEATPLPTQAATQPTGAPSMVPNDPTPRTSTVSSAGVVVGRATDALATALPVESSTTSCPHPATGTGGTVVGGPTVVPGPDPICPPGRVMGAFPATPEDAPPLPVVVPPPTVPTGA